LKYLHLIFLVLLFQKSIFAQLDNSSLFFNQNNDTCFEKKAFLKIQNFNYMKNNEYYGPITHGFTLFGFQFNPQIGYQLSQNLSLEGGVFLQKDFGNKEFTNVDPTFLLRYSKNHFKMIFGTIDGSLNHQLIEPIYNFERVITNRLENGAQFILNKRYFDVDVWVDWQSVLYNAVDAKEKIWAGFNANVLKFSHKKLEVQIPVQGTILHLGGQTDTVAVDFTKNFNFSPGLILKYNLNTKYLKSIHADTRYVMRKNSLQDSLKVTSNGDGLLANVGLTTTFDANILFSYWYGHNFYSDFGGFLYSSQSSAPAYPYYVEHIRSLLIMRVTKKFKLANNVVLTLRAEPYCDFKLNLFEYSFGFYISLDERIWLKKK
jgi:hypothetical protein